MFKLRIGAIVAGFGLLFVLIAPASILIMWVFLALGGVLMKSGWEEVKKDRATDQYGESVYGIVLDILETGAVSNGHKEYKASVLIARNDAVFEYSDIIGFDRNAYRRGDYIRCKYFQGDINLLNILRDDDIPYDILSMLNDEFDARGGAEERVRRELREAYKNGQFRQAQDSVNKKNQKWEHSDSNYDW